VQLEKRFGRDDSQSKHPRPSLPGIAEVPATVAEAPSEIVAVPASGSAAVARVAPCGIAPPSGIAAEERLLCGAGGGGDGDRVGDSGGGGGGGVDLRVAVEQQLTFYF